LDLFLVFIKMKRKKGSEKKNDWKKSIKEIEWSATRVDKANYCRFGYALHYVEKSPELNLPVFPKGRLLHDLTQHFRKRLGKEENISLATGKYKGNRVKYHDAESFGRYAWRCWTKIVMSDYLNRTKLEKILHTTKERRLSEKEVKEKESIEERLVDWGDITEKWTIRESIPKICEPLFNILINEEKPLFSELAFKFIAGKYIIKGRIDAVFNRNGKVVIRDYKSGRPWIGPMKFNHDPQLTIYNVGLCNLAFTNVETARKLGLEERRNEYMGNPIFADPEFEMEFFMMEAPKVAKDLKEKAKGKKSKNPRVPKTIYTTNRTDDHFYEVLAMIRGTEISIANGDYYPERGRKCDSCSMKLACNEELKKARDKIATERDGQILIYETAPLYKKPVEISPATFEDASVEKQRGFNFKRKIPY